MNVKNPWEQLPGETDTAYHRFSVYLELGPDRSFRKVREELGKTSGYDRQLETWSSKFDWVHRAGQYDKHIIKKSLENREEVMDRLTAKVLSRAEDLIDELLDIAMHEGTEMAGEGMTNVYAQKVKAIESALDRIGFVKQKEAPELEKPDSVNTYIQNIYKRIGVIREGKVDSQTTN